MPMLPFHPAPGLGDLLPGSFVVPQNPLRPDSTPLVPSVQAAAGGKVAYRPKIGDLLPGAFVVPQNPIIRNITQGGMSGIGCPGCQGMSPAYDGSGFHSSGLQGLDFTSATTWLQESTVVSGVSNWMLVAGAIGAYLLFMPGGADYREARRDLDRQYRGYRRAARRVA